MKHFRTEVDIQAPPDAVWKIMRNVERWSEWTPSVKSTRLLGDGVLRVGSRAIVHQPKLPPALWRVIELDESARMFTWMSWSPGLRVIARHSVDADGEGSRAFLSIRFEGILSGLVAAITRTLNERYLAIEAQGLKSRAENARFETAWLNRVRNPSHTSGSGVFLT